jgi:hypothetical protein
MRAICLVLFALLLSACGPQRVVRHPGAVSSETVQTGWTRFSDREHLTAVVPARGRLWALSRAGVVSWDRGSAQFKAEVGAEAPGLGARVLAVADDGPVYVGLPDGLAWKDPKGWHRSAVGFLAGGVRALTPRNGGGVWVAGPGGLGWFQGGRLWEAGRRYQITALARGSAGAVWASTEAHGVLALTDATITEHTVEQGLCGQRVTALGVGADGRVAATCPNGTFAVFNGSRWRIWRLKEAGALSRVQPVRGGLAVQSSLGWHLAERVRAPTSRPRVGGARMVVVEGSLGAVPPLPRPTPPAEVKPDHRPPPVPMPAPIVPVAPKVVQAKLRLLRAMLRGKPVAAGQWVVTPWPVPAAPGAVTASHMGTDRSLWRAVAHRGVSQFRGPTLKRYASRSLVTLEGTAALAVDRADRLIWSDNTGRPWRNDGRSWHAMALPGPGRLTSLVADATGDIWAVLVVDPPPAQPALVQTITPESGAPVVVRRARPELRILRSTGDGPWAQMARLAVVTEGQVFTGQLAVSPTGALYLPLFAQRGGQRTALGLGHIASSHDRLQIYTGRLGYDGEGSDGELILPDAWVNDVAVAPNGTLFVATNAGLVRRDAGKTVLFDENAFIDSEVILGVQIDAQSRAWVGTFEGLGRLEGDQWQPIRLAGLKGQSISAMAIGPDGTVWIGTQKGLWAGRDGRWRQVPVGGRLQTGPIRGIAVTRKGDLWISTMQGLALRVRQ